MTVTADDIAALVLKHYDALPAKRKPVVRGNGLREWVPLAGIVAQGKDDELWCLSLTTGMKCLPTLKISQAQGNILHDWHAEVLAIRAFNRFVLDECKVLAEGGFSEYLRWRTPLGQQQDEAWHAQPFTWKQDITLHMYCSEAPCGDASMELIMASQEDATPWDLPPATLPNTDPNTASTLSTLPGRAYFSHLGIVRRKPSRPDAPATLSKSCSDKLAQKQCTSLLASTTSLLVDPSHVYIHTLILPKSRYSESACRRAFSSEGRMRSLTHPSHNDEKRGGYTFRPFTVETTTLEFEFSQRSVAGPADSSSDDKSIDEQENRTQTLVKIAPSNISAAWTRTQPSEATLGGVLQGRKQSAADDKGASFASRRRMWEIAVEVADVLPFLPKGKLEDEGVKGIRRALRSETYGGIKDSVLLEPRRKAKEEARVEALKGWVRNLGDESFTLKST
ncbi:adenosine deaminase/editase [Hypoxylon trugodes]|uniref:adenosine deaminase/editase n=1 Tax=Hypoxylon trugodes TaxID=326681 RepID=UPI0021910D50|nr:adenosine deaminase/editase [Hypoxylon trugodes]KAI1392568.1 adenosine deaminase/editase [Hypoxylon trugodes]